MDKLYFATGNLAKIKQAQFLINRFAFPLEPPKQASLMFGDLASYKEKGNTPLLIALQGALDVYKKIQLPVFTEDSILEIPGLDGYPGVRSNAMLKTLGRQDIINKLKNAASRQARMTSVIAYVDKNGKSKVFKHVIQGSIAKHEKWKPGEDIWVGPSLTPLGGGYNAIFIPAGETKTLAEFSAEEGITRGYRENTFIAFFSYLTGKKPFPERIEEVLPERSFEDLNRD